MKILAVDYGDSRTGLAVCDPGELVVTPIHPQIEEKSMNKVAQAVADAAAAQKAERIVVGLPKNMDGSEGSRAQKCHKLAGKIAEYSGLTVAMCDERRTTVSAAAILTENATFGQKRKERLDAVSAAVILESYLAWRKNHPDEA